MSVYWPKADAASAAPNTGLDFNAQNGNSVVPVAKYWRCNRRRGFKVTHMTFPRGRTPVCHYTRVSYSGGWQVTRAAWRHCRRKYGVRVIRALESRTQYRCIYRR
ncbi:MAG TPA: hypothetical protein VM325_11100 [Alphaproteobacteria bacterium]|nr:hypothetical protein [Alphaproteobacteria bacterium]